MKALSWRRVVDVVVVMVVMVVVGLASEVVRAVEQQIAAGNDRQIAAAFGPGTAFQVLVDSIAVTGQTDGASVFSDPPNHLQLVPERLPSDYFAKKNDVAETSEEAAAPPAPPEGKLAQALFLGAMAVLFFLGGLFAWIGVMSSRAPRRPVIVLATRLTR